MVGLPLSFNSEFSKNMWNCLHGDSASPASLKIQGSCRLCPAIRSGSGRGRSPKQNQGGIVARGSLALRVPTPTSISESVEVFYREGLQAPPQLARSAMNRDTGIPGCPKRQERKRQPKRKWIELWEEGDGLSSSRWNPFTTWEKKTCTFSMYYVMGRTHEGCDGQRGYMCKATITFNKYIGGVP